MERLTADHFKSPHLPRQSLYSVTNDGLSQELGPDRPSASAAINIVGAGSLSQDGPQPLRYEINTFSQSGPGWDLYVQALAAIQARDEADPMSYFQISGTSIHGYPNLPWDGVVGTGTYPGYCMHSSELFPTWHRPYLALFEQQAIWDAAQTIAQSYPNDSRSTYTEAAENLRIPYWDTVANPWLPDVTTASVLQINTPSGQQTVNNPLLSYTFQRSPSANNFPPGGALSSFPTTVRWWNGRTSNQSAVTASLQAGAASNLALTYGFFTSVADYITFSSTATLPNQTSDSGLNIENVHNNIHNSIGGYGHMTDPTMAAFDPIFWLHHTNVDRQLALWQALYPDSYVQPEVNNYGSYYILKGSIDEGTTPLAPFHNTDDGSSMWTSDGIRSLATFRYSYPELPYWSLSASELQANVRNAVNQLYNPGSGTQRRRTVKAKPRTASLADAFSSITFQETRDLGINNAVRQWFARLRLQKYAANTAFTVLAFIGDPPEDTSQWTWAPNLVGALGQFIPINATDLFPNGPPAGESEGQIALTHAALTGVNRGIIPDLSPDAVLPLLRDTLQWRVQAAEGCEIDIGSLTGLSIQIGSRGARPATHPDEFPIYDDIEWHETLS
ncbi:hypothetical protein DV735_g3553, partial [Chaetothyriales sp. CBS 134920]